MLFKNQLSNYFYAKKMKLLGTLILTCVCFLNGAAQNEPVVTTYVNEPNPTAVLFTSALSGLSLYTGLVNIKLGTQGRASYGSSAGGLSVGSTQIVFGVILFSTSIKSYNNQGVVNKSNLHLGAINVGLGLLSFSSALFSEVQANRNTKSDTAWNFRANSVPDGRGGFQLGFSHKV